MDEFDDRDLALPRWKEWLLIGIPVGRLFGVRVRLHILLIISLLYIWSWSEGLAPAWRLGLWALSAFGLFGSVLLHELGHCYGARRVGGEASQIILWPLGGLAVLSGMEKGPREELIVTALGPAVSLGLALGFWGAVFAMPDQAWAQIPLFVCWSLAWINTMLFVFNMAVPLFPMDCARIVRSLLALRFHPNHVTYWLCTGGMFLGAGIALASVMMMFAGGEGAWPWLGLIGMLGALTSRQERQRCQMMNVYRDGPWYWRHATWKAETAPDNKPPGREAVEALRGLGRKARQSARRPAASPGEIVEVTTSADRRARLREQLEQAVRAEDFERAARLRDQIRELDDRPAKSR